MSSHDATFYLQLEPEFRRWIASGEQEVCSIKAVALTQKRPIRQRSGTVMVKLTVRVPDAAFLPLRPEAVVVIPEDMTVTGPIEVEAEDLNDDRIVNGLGMDIENDDE
jgi:hypothetical protein